MRKCSKCQIEVLNETHICPLCLSVLEQSGEVIGTKPYPTIDLSMQNYHLLKRIFSFTLILIVVLLSLANYLFYNSLVGYIIVFSSATYFALTFNYSILHHANFAAKILVQTIGAQILMIIFDYAIGYRGWSLTFALPCICFLASIGIMILMLVNRMNWQEYIMYQLCMTILSLSQIVLIVLKVIKWPILGIISVTISILILIGTIIFGNKDVSGELSRRFHTK